MILVRGEENPAEQGKPRASGDDPAWPEITVYAAT